MNNLFDFKKFLEDNEFSIIDKAKSLMYKDVNSPVKAVFDAIINKINELELNNDKTDVSSDK